MFEQNDNLDAVEKMCVKENESCMFVYLYSFEMLGVVAGRLCCKRKNQIAQIHQLCEESSTNTRSINNAAGQAK
jgi:hypothetical protein